MRNKKEVTGNTDILLRTTSCVGEPKVTALQSLKSDDLRLFTDTVNCEGEEGVSLSPSHWINQVLEEEDDKTLLMVAISSRLHHYIEVLLKAGASADQYSQELGLAPLHLAVQIGDLASVKLLLDIKKVRSGNRADVNQVTKSGRTALHLAVEQREVDILDLLLQQKEIEMDKGDNKGQQTPLYLAVRARNPQMVEMLMEYGASLDKVCLGKPVQVHITEKMPGFDVSSVTVKRTPIIRQVSESVLERMSVIVDTFSRRCDPATQSRLLSEFQSLVLQSDSKSMTTFRSSGLTLLQRAAAGNDICCKLVNILLQEGVDPDYIRVEGEATPVHLAASRGSLEILKVLKNHRANFSLVKKSTEETVLHRLLIKDDEYEDGKFEECFDLIMMDEEDNFKNQIDKIINKRDLLGNTALHYATQRWSAGAVRSLLERGANIGIKNQWGEVPINKISPVVMEQFLDEFCLQAKNDVNREDFEVTFNYQFLAPPLDSLPPSLAGPCLADDDDEAGQMKLSPENMERRKFALPETESLWYMGQNKEHRHLLKHPVITSFLWAKWTRIRRFVNRNLRFYLFFVVILTWFIFEKFGGDKLRSGKEHTVREFYVMFVIFATVIVMLVIKDWISDMAGITHNQLIMDEGGFQDSRKSRSCCSYLKLCLRNWPEVILLAGVSLVLAFGVSVLYPALVILLTGLVARELFQMAVSLRRYFLTVENWLELIMLITVGVVVFLPDKEDNKDLRRHMAAISLLLSWAELVTFVAKHPRLTRYNVYVTMFYKVFASFFFFLLWYIFFIVAFSLGFYIMLHTDENKSTQPNETLSVEYEQEDSEKELQVFFNNPFLTFVKTCTMFIGELEFSDIPINLDSNMMPLSYIFFLAFVFLIVVVLMNLLNGLAVSDTGKIQEQAEIVSYLSRVETISYAESLLLGDPFDFLSNTPAVKWVLDIPSFSFCRQLYRNKTTRRIFQRMTGAQSILLFYNFLPDKRMTIKPNKKEQPCLAQVSGIGGDIVDAAKTIVLKREKEMEQRKQGKEAEAVNKDLIDKVNMLEKKIDLLLSKL